MKWRGVKVLLVGTLLALGGLGGEVAAQTDGRDWETLPSRGKQRQLERELERLRQELEELREKVEARPGTPADPPPSEAGAEGEDGVSPGLEVTPFWARERVETPRALRGTYDRPFLASLWRRAYLGGYTEMEYHSFEDGILGIPHGFRMHRTNLFLFTDLTDRLRFGSELEFETEFEGEGNSSDIEVALEMAFVDWTLFEELKLRGGAMVIPLGRINVNHDGPARDLTERPLVSTFVIPSTFTEVGAGALGTFTLSPDLALDYQIYAVNGFNLLSSDGELAAEFTEREKLLREGRTSLGGDVNERPASTGRIALEALASLEIGASWHVGTYDEEGDNILGIYAGDFAWLPRLGDLEFGLEGEIALADFERDEFARTAGVPDRFWGYYIQGSVGGMPDFLRELAPAAFGDPGATIHLVFRYERVDLDGDLGEVFEPGLVFRPAPDTAFKFSYRLTSRSIGLRDVPGREDWDDDGFVFSLTSYF